jgi:hypothetical protein
MYDPATYSNSNKADMLFMDIDPGLPQPEPVQGSTFYSTMAHEFQHLINWSIRSYKTSPGNEITATETWLDEGLSLSAEYVYGGEEKSRVDYFNTDPNETIVKGNNFFYWNINGDTWDNDVLADYATAYLFFRWLGIHGGGSIYTAILNSAGSNYQAVTGAAGAISTGIDTGASEWDALLSGWMRANMIGNATGYFGYKGEVAGQQTAVPQAKYLDNTNGASISLYPGEGVFSRWSAGTPSGGGSNIKYISNVPIGTSGYKVLLTWNGNTATGGGKETGYLANTAGGRSAAPGGPAASGGGEGITLPASYPVGFRDLPGERARAGGRSAGRGLEK